MNWQNAHHRKVQQLKIISVLLQTQWTTMLRKSPSLQSIETSRYGVSGQGRNKVELVYEFVPNITPCDFRTISQQQACRWARQHPQLSQLTERLIPRRWFETPPQGPSRSQPATDTGKKCYFSTTREQSRHSFAKNKLCISLHIIADARRYQETSFPCFMHTLNIGHNPVDIWSEKYNFYWLYQT